MSDSNTKKEHRISKSMERAFESGCMCFFDYGKEAEFAERLKKQKEEDSRTSYVDTNIDAGSINTIADTNKSTGEDKYMQDED